MKVERILAGIDLGEDTEKVLAYASFFTKNLGGSLRLLNVIDFLVTPPAYLARYMEEEKRLAEQSFLPWTNRLETDGMKATFEVMIGRLHETFDTVVREQKADMLVLGFRSHALRQSSSERLVKGLQIPILVVKGKKSETAKIGSVKMKRILCPVDFSETSRKALETANELKNIFLSELDVIYVFPGHVIAKKMETWKEEKAAERLSQQASDDLDRFLVSAGVKKAGTIEEGEPSEKIVSFASEKESDLMIIGARGLSPVKGTLIGSVADAVIKSSPCPVLVIH